MFACPRANEGSLDRLLRVLLSVIIVSGAYYWLSGTLQIVLYVLGVILLGTAFTGYCALYTLAGIDTLQKRSGRVLTILLLALIGITAVALPVASAFFTKKLFLEDYNAMYSPYKQALFATGNTPTEGPAAFETFTAAFQKFQTRYAAYRPSFLKGDEALATDLTHIQQIIQVTKPMIQEGQMSSAHTSLEQIRPIVNELLRRNNLSPLSVALVDFHDAMEQVYNPAVASDLAGVLQALPNTEEKLREVEALSQEAGIKTIRDALDRVREAANKGDASATAENAKALKSAYVQVYIQQ